MKSNKYSRENKTHLIKCLIYIYKYMDNVWHLSKLWHEYLRLSRNCAALAESLKKWSSLSKEMEFF